MRRVDQLFLDVQIRFVWGSVRMSRSESHLRRRRKNARKASSSISEAPSPMAMDVRRHGKHRGLFDQLTSTQGGDVSFARWQGVKPVHCMVFPVHRKDDQLHERSKHEILVVENGRYVLVDHLGEHSAVDRTLLLDRCQICEVDMSDPLGPFELRVAGDRCCV